MKIKFQYLIIGLTLLSCSESLNNLSGKNLYNYTYNSDFFPEKVIQNKHFHAHSYAEIIRQLNEKSLADRSRGHEIIRLTSIRSFSNHFTILIERTDEGVLLTEKETYRDSRPSDNGDSTKIIYNVIEFDSLTGKYMDVRKFMPVGKCPGIEIEIERKTVNPLLKNESRAIKREDWNRLTKLLDDTSFFEMLPTDNTALGFDGNHFVLETHSKNGYYVVDRWSPKEGDFKRILDYVIGLTDRKGVDN